MGRLWEDERFAWLRRMISEVRRERDPLRRTLKSLQLAVLVAALAVGTLAALALLVTALGFLRILLFDL